MPQLQCATFGNSPQVVFEAYLRTCASSASERRSVGAVSGTVVTLPVVDIVADEDGSVGGDDAINKMCFASFASDQAGVRAGLFGTQSRHSILMAYAISANDQQLAVVVDATSGLWGFETPSLVINGEKS